MDNPEHIAIIMDGNGRWAKERHLPKLAGHKKGVETVRKIVESCIKFDIRYLTLYAFSAENWARPKDEVNGLFKLLDNFLDREMALFHDNKVRLCIIGERDRLRENLRKKIEKYELETRGYKTLTTNIALSYGSRQEILGAVKSIIKDVKDGVLDPSCIDEKAFASYLYTRDCPDPDLLIRTSGEMRVSNFLLWQISYSELYVTKKYWPDFTGSDLKKAIDEYKARERRFGGR
ncbi:MAG: isoprenyl transferase [Candidatus Omnitrophota bacterium]